MVHIRTVLRQVLFLLGGANRLNGFDEEHSARAFHLLLIGFLVWMGFMEFLVVPLFVVRKVAIAILLLLFAGAALAALVLLRRGFKRAAAVQFLCVTWSVAGVASLFSGGVGTNFPAWAIVVILVAGWLLSRTVAFGFAAATLLLSFVEAFLEYIGHPLPRYFPGAPMARWGAEVGIVLLSVGPLLAFLETLRRQASAIRESEERFHSLSNAALDGIMIHDRGVILDTNLAFARLFGYERPEDLIGKNGLELLTPESQVLIRERMEGHEAGPIEVTCVRKAGATFAAETECHAVKHLGHDARLVAYRDLTERKQAEAEKAKLQAQLHQAQKMESIGRLAGGMAHDFNNLLTVINGYSQLVLGELSASDPLRNRILEIHKAGEHAAGLTRQLLAFSRKQVLQTRTLNFDRVVQGMQPMLELVVGEDVELQLSLNAHRATVHADPHQLEQVILNLAVNARDAMPDGGRLLIETAKVELDESYVQSHADARTGRHVVLAVSDNGIGMDEATQQLIFEPFFTTKEAGKGTGLGLSMVQGIIAQSGGHIEVCSELGQGTTFKIYLPALAEETADAGMPATVPAPGGKETVLVVEDVAEVRNYAVEVLKTYGYHVIPAENGGEALLLCERERQHIHLVLTDAVMPNLSGWELAKRLEKLRTGIKVLFMSGYTDDVIPHHGALDNGVHFIHKPFSPEQLAVKVRAVLESQRPAARILLADDEAGVRGFMRAALEQGGYEVIEAADGRQALQQLRAGQVDLLITDLVMPVLEGLETIRALRKDDPGVRVIAISGAFGSQYLKTAQLLGADAVLSKPMTAELLLTSVAEVLKLKHEKEF